MRPGRDYIPVFEWRDTDGIDFTAAILSLIQYTEKPLRRPCPW